MAASWTAYGYLIARLFLVDPAAIIGSYKGVADFVKQCEQCRAWKTKTDGPNALDFLKLLEDCTVIA